MGEIQRSLLRRGLAKAAKRDIRFMGRKEKAVAASLVSGPGPGPNPRESVVSTAKAGFESTTNSCKAYYDNLVPVRAAPSLVINDHRLCASRCSLSRSATRLFILQRRNYDGRHVDEHFRLIDKRIALREFPERLTRSGKYVPHGSRDMREVNRSLFYLGIGLSLSLSSPLAFLLVVTHVDLIYAISRTKLLPASIIEDRL